MLVFSSNSSSYWLQRAIPTTTSTASAQPVPTPRVPVQGGVDNGRAPVQSGVDNSSYASRSRVPTQSGRGDAGYAPRSRAPIHSGDIDNYTGYGHQQPPSQTSYKPMPSSRLQRQV